MRAGIQSVQRNTMKITKHRVRRNRNFIILILVCAVVGYLDSALFEKETKFKAGGPIISVYHTETGELMHLDLEEYIIGVVAAEMPASFELEALKAQAVAARTFALNRMLHSNSKITEQHPKAQITTSPATCQAWINDAVQKKRWGSNYRLWHDKIVQAVAETRGKVMLYEGELIDPVYHASCGGSYTEDAEAVWGTAKPYLVHVNCAHPADKHSGEIKILSLQNFITQLQLTENIATSVIHDSDDWLKIIERTESGRVKTLLIGNQIVRGVELRSKLGLKSTLMDISVEEGLVTIITSGYGHGAGMCQYGANYYAQQGYDYSQILLYYYPGITLQHL